MGLRLVKFDYTFLFKVFSVIIIVTVTLDIPAILQQRKLLQIQMSGSYIYIFETINTYNLLALFRETKHRPNLGLLFRAKELAYV